MKPSRIAFVAALLFFAGTSMGEDVSALPQGVTRLPVVFSGGYETEGVDRGRPVILIANALGVSPEIFRDAFSRVHPADQGKGPTGDEARQNKKVLMDALGKYGISNERLDAVSNYYRYVRNRDELWTHKPAEANALVKDGVVIGYEIMKGGAGYSSPPAISIPNMKVDAPKVELFFGKDLEKNGSVVSILPREKEKK